ncbi:hypothetical protein [Helicobacter marmotae]|uniref:hypothetical protein n=1 Tax=Helicobacter marmotae TaxID=152490 RepID=UPI0014733977|nr:hypothetical protein [Helicobacter marmotae]
MATRKGNPHIINTCKGNLLCHSKHCEETSPESLTTPLFCHSEGGRSPTEESLPELLVAHRDSSLRRGYAQNDNESQMSPSSEIYSHHRIKLNRTKCHLLKRRRGGGYIRGQEYYYGVGACLHERSSCPPIIL